MPLSENNGENSWQEETYGGMKNDRRPLLPAIDSFDYPPRFMIGKLQVLFPLLISKTEEKIEETQVGREDKKEDSESTAKQ